MAKKLVNTTQLEYDLSRIAQAIRDKLEYSEYYTLTFPQGMANEIRNNGLKLPDTFASDEAEKIIAPGKPVFKSIDEDELNNNIRQIADTIREVSGFYDITFSFPEGIIGAINAMNNNYFSFAGSQYFYNQGETWGEWINREGGNYTFYTDSNGYVVYATEYWYVLLNGNYVLANDLISSTSYDYTSSEPVGNYITFWYNSSEYSVPAGTTWEEFVYSGQVSSLSVMSRFGEYYIYDYAQDSFVGTYDTYAPVKASDTIVEYQNYYHGFEPGGGDSDMVTFTVDGTEYKVARYTVIDQWLNSQAAPSYYINKGGYLYNSNEGCYVAEYAALSNGTYEAASIADTIYDGNAYYSNSNVHIPYGPDNTFSLDNTYYPFTPGQTWREMINEYGNYENLWGHVTINSQGYVILSDYYNDETAAVGICGGNMAEHEMVWEKADNKIRANGNYYSLEGIMLNTKRRLYNANEYSGNSSGDWFIQEGSIEVTVTDDYTYDSANGAYAPIRNTYSISGPYGYVSLNGDVSSNDTIRAEYIGYGVVDVKDYGISLSPSGGNPYTCYPYNGATVSGYFGGNSNPGATFFNEMVFHNCLVPVSFGHWILYNTQIV